MSLRDKSCYTLTIHPSGTDPAVLELVESMGPATGNEEPRYARVKETRQDEGYSSAIYDVLTGARLASAGYTIEKAKKRRLQLHGPDEDVPFDFTGKINFEWSFIFEGNKYRWRREIYGKDYICTMDRKPDPPVEICLAREGDKKEPAKIQILHYNIDRFPNEIKDLRGLETLLVASLLCLLDASEDRSTTLSSKLSKSAPSPSPPSLPSKDSPIIPLQPQPERVISEEDFEPENPNEIIVGKNTNIDDHIARAVGLLEDPETLFIVIRTRSPEAHQRALEVSLGVKRFRHHENLSDLHQYIIEDTPPFPPNQQQSTRPGPRVINLDDESISSSPRPSLSTSSSQRRKFTPTKTQTQTQSQKEPRSPPQNMVIYLSTIVLPDLDPRRRSSSSTKNSYPYANEGNGHGNGHGQVNGGGGKMEFGGEEVSTSTSAPTAAGTPAVGGSHMAGSGGSGGNGSAVKSFRGKLGKKLFRSSS
ncbi:hypothetical protein C361_06554 [Cryptococcus neoformans Tu259-1]|uniref:Uncharacterized protein n=1 Tax=Cryptococcus neoformans Tu259-1 TaxID=1230072 RepID=A0A854Q5E6_CRYNE|nr:hypothetical protein C353_06377 [Cryptococcus neoformans var. grubii AD1-83a]OXG11449.1 hypothetical protein C361_06554 [Cryptococcus neoformans var. grubii Tu259-1]OXG46895.1 hypothetical protein C354_06364 [Cryptococcus neoformans var. grubii MW-RSA1955]OXG50609.1 hypothetical protein C352_06382 [Cryptococcus neoformans var. grubii CHC193]OXG57478.1 hypothetical protein C351_06408 [Cryptococcus neoformans var. grubii c8]OXH01988.1 hypothetical protein C369_06500 [Cryptococcus neoformans v